MMRVLVALLAVAAGVACFAGGDEEPQTAADQLRASVTEVAGTATAAATRRSTPTTRVTATPAPTAVAGNREISGRHFRAVAPRDWLLVDPERRFDVEQEAAIAELPAAVRDEVRQLQRDAETELILTGLPTETDSRIVVGSICEPTWSFGPGDWMSLMDLTLRVDAGVEVRRLSVSIDEIPYPVLEVSGAAGVHFSVHPASRDGCTYGISLHGAAAEAALPEFRAFARGLELGIDGGDSSLPDGSLVPAAWTALSGRAFDAALAEDWFYNDTSEPLTAEQLAVMEGLDGTVGALTAAEQAKSDQVELIYTGLPGEAESLMMIQSFCDGPADLSASEWAEVATGLRGSGAASVEDSSLRVTVDGELYEIYLVDYVDSLEFDVYPVDPDGCNHVFSTAPADNVLGALADFVMFMQTVELHGQVLGADTRLEGRHFVAELPPGWVFLDAELPRSAETESTLAELPPAAAEEIRADLVFFEGSQVVYPALPEKTETWILVTVVCGYPAWAGADWESLNREDYVAQGLEMVGSGTQVAIGGVAHEVWEVVSSGELERFVLPVKDGCLYSFGLEGGVTDDKVYAEFLSFLETVTLGADG